jgi:hypothetical protein
LESQYQADYYRLENNIFKNYPIELAGISNRIDGYKADIILRDKHDSSEFLMRLGKREFKERKDAGEVLLKALGSSQYAGKNIGVYRGFEIIPKERNRLLDSPEIILKGSLSYTVQLSESDVGSIARIENTVTNLEKWILEATQNKKDVEQRLLASKTQLQQPFEHDEALRATLSELEMVNATLDIEKGGDDDAVVDDVPAAGQNEDTLRLDDEAIDDELEM